MSPARLSPATRWLGALALAVPFAVGWGVSASSGATGQEVTRFTDAELTESSGAVLAGDRLWTTNDSGDAGRLFEVDLRTGDTLRTLAFDDDARDVEALAGEGEGDDLRAVWVGDTGDNLRRRDDVRITRVPLDGSAPTVWPLRLPDGPRDVEALLRHPRTGQLFVVTKGVLGGEVLALPRPGRPGQPLRAVVVADAPGMVTDGAFTPDGRFAVLRTYTRAVVLAVPGWSVVGSFDLPAQEQGEGLAVTPDGDLLLTSEGRHAPVLRVGLPRRVQRDMAEALEPTSSASSTGTTTAGPVAPQDAPQDATPSAPEPDTWPWVAGGLLGVVVLLILVRSLRPR